MQESQLVKPVYRLRLTERFVFYDPDRGSHLFREWLEGAIVTDETEIELLTARGAPAVRIEDPKPIPKF